MKSVKFMQKQPSRNYITFTKFLKLCHSFGDLQAFSSNAKRLFREEHILQEQNIAVITQYMEVEQKEKKY